MDGMKVREYLKHAPREPGPIAPHLRGHWFGDGWYICARCAGRLAARGLTLPAGAIPVWDDRAEPYGICCGCSQ